MVRRASRRSYAGLVSDEWNEDERATRAASTALPAGFVILWNRDDFGAFCGDLYAPSGHMLCGLPGERGRVLRVLSESAREYAEDACGDLDSLPADPRRYTISANGRAITHHACGRTSFNPDDVANAYCFACHVFL